VREALILVVLVASFTPTSAVAAADGGYVSATDAPKCIAAAPGFRDTQLTQGSKFGCYAFSENGHWFQLCPYFPFVMLGADTREQCEAFRAVAERAGLFGSDPGRKPQ
jgi:hypothetical protein